MNAIALKNRTAIVTGGARGIGFAIAGTAFDISGGGQCIEIAIKKPPDRWIGLLLQRDDLSLNR